MRDKTYDKEIMHHFFQCSVPFFTRAVPLDEKQFKYEFHEAHSDWIDISLHAETYPMKPSLIKPLFELFEEARLYFACIICSDEPYLRAIRTHRDRWMKLQKFANAILSEAEF